MAYEYTRIADYGLEIVWSYGTAVSTAEYDDVSRYYLNDPGIIVDGIGRDQARAYAPPNTPALDVTLSNETGRFSPGGPLAGFVTRGPQVNFTYSYGPDVPVDAADVPANDTEILANGTLSGTLFTGFVDQAPQQIDYTSGAAVQIRALGSMAILLDKDITVALQESITVDVAIGLILDAVEWPADKRIIDTASSTLLYWWLNNENALNALLTLVRTEGAGGNAYQDGEGYFHFEGRNFREGNPRSLSTQWIFTDGFLSGDPLADSSEIFADDPDVLASGAGNQYFHMVPAQWRSNPDEVVAETRALVNTRTPTSTMKIWEYGGPLVLTSSQVLDIYVTASDPFKSAVTPVAATDYTVSAGSLTSVALIGTSGQTIILRLTAGGAGATVLGVTSNGIQVRAVSLPITSSQTVVSQVDTALSAARTRPKTFTLDIWPEIARNSAQDIVDALTQRYQRERPQMTIRVQNVDARHMRAILNTRISDRVNVRHAHAEIGDSFWVEAIRYELTPGGGMMTLVMELEKVYEIIGGRYDSAVYDTDVYGA